MVTRLPLDEKVKIVAEAGLNPDDARVWYEKYQNHKETARRRGLESKLTFFDYTTKVAEAHISEPSQIGQHAGLFQLGRVGDIGDYTKEDCRFISREQNHQEALENGRYVAMGLARRGRTKETHPGVAAQSIAITGRTKDTHPGIAAAAEKRTGHTKSTHAHVAAQADKVAKDYVVWDPDGNEYQIHNLNEFCKHHDINRGHMNSVCCGNVAHHKGWTGCRIVCD